MQKFFCCWFGCKPVVLGIQTWKPRNLWVEGSSKSSIFGEFQLELGFEAPEEELLGQ